VKIHKNIFSLLLPGIICAFSSAAMAAESSQAVRTGGTPWGWWIAPLSSIAALVFAYIFYKQML
jgi:putative solute:sodium symporter small subunit